MQRGYMNIFKILVNIWSISHQTALQFHVLLCVYLDMLGEKTFEDLTLLFMRGLSLKEAANKFKSKNVNYETLETCFLLSSKK